MMGYGPEDKNAVLELTYNYGVKEYDKGNGYAQVNEDFPLLYTTSTVKNKNREENGCYSKQTSAIFKSIYVYTSIYCCIYIMQFVVHYATMVNIMDLINKWYWLLSFLSEYIVTDVVSNNY